MSFLRTLMARYRAAALLLVAAAMAMKAIVPAGYMIGGRAMALTVEVCADTTGEHLTRQIIVPVSGEIPEDRASKAASACPFTSLWAAGFLHAAPALVAIALAFILTLGFAELRWRPLAHARYLRPHLRAPPN